MLELTIETLTHAGEGLGRHEGRAVFVPYALPGETVRVEIVEEKKNYARARLLAVVRAAAERVAPRCPHHFAIEPPEGPGAARPGLACGGCQLQHLSDTAQLDFKTRLVRDQLVRIGGMAEPVVRPGLAPSQPYYYRNHTQFALTPEGRLGFRAAQSHRVVPVAECHQIEPVLGALFPRIVVEAEAAPAWERISLRSGAEGEALIVFEGRPEAPEIELDLPVSAALARADGSVMTLAGRDYVVIEVRGRPFRVSALSFFQVNTAGAEALVGLVLEGLALAGGEAVLDVYSGVGLFSAFIAPTAGRVVGVEAYAPAVADAAANLDEFDNVEIYEATAEAALPRLAGPFEAAVLDPPRAGCAPEALDALASLKVARIVYVACDAATLARDLKRLAAAGYGLDWAQPVDLFPQTHHVECVARLTRQA
jgi:23S rRNA (uracil1939-C5)-methyltransferase